METHDYHVYPTKLDRSGRIVIPAEARLRKKWSEGDTVLLVEDERGIQLKTLHQAVQEAQDYFCKVIPKEVRLVDELIEERRDEALRE